VGLWGIKFRAIPKSTLHPSLRKFLYSKIKAIPLIFIHIDNSKRDRIALIFEYKNFRNDGLTESEAARMFGYFKK
jgi:hypothetical protein